MTGPAKPPPSPRRSGGGLLLLLAVGLVIWIVSSLQDEDERPGEASGRRGASKGPSRVIEEAGVPGVTDETAGGATGPNGEHRAALATDALTIQGKLADEFSGAALAGANLTVGIDPTPPTIGARDDKGEDHLMLTGVSRDDGAFTLRTRPLDRFRAFVQIECDGYPLMRTTWFVVEDPGELGELGLFRIPPFRRVDVRVTEGEKKSDPGATVELRFHRQLSPAGPRGERLQVRGKKMVFSIPIGRTATLDRKLPIGRHQR